MGYRYDLPSLLFVKKNLRLYQRQQNNIIFTVRVHQDWDVVSFAVLN